jgi:hypothetical protein
MGRGAWIVVASLVLLAAVVVAVALTRSRAGAPADDARVLAAVERIAQAQARQDERLARLEARVAPMPGAPPMGATLPAGAPRAAPGPTGNGAPQDPAAMEAHLQAQLHALDDRLVSEPLSPQWAKANEQAIGRFLAPANLARENVPAPSASEASCKSRLCRIRLTFADEQQAGQTQTSLLMAIADGLPHAQSFLLPRKDGGVDLVVYAAGDPQALR